MLSLEVTCHQRVGIRCHVEARSIERAAGPCGAGGGWADWMHWRSFAKRSRALRLHAAPKTGPCSSDRTPANSAGMVGRRRLLSAAPVICCGCPNCRPRLSFMDKSFAAAMATGMNEYEAAIAPVKRRLFDKLFEGLGAGSSTSAASLALAAAGEEAVDGARLPSVLEVGIGTGPNLPYFRRSGADVRIVGVDPNPYMREHLQQAAARWGWQPSRLDWVQGEAEALPLADASVDAAVCTLVLCSVADVPAVLAEVRRVLRPGGRLLFIEHTSAPQDAPPLFRLAQWSLNPLQQLLADGCHLDRDPLPHIQAAFASVEAERLEVPGMQLIAPHVAGIATA